MKKFTDFLVNRRYFVLAAALLLTVYSLTLISKVNIISDMTEYLPDDSQMKIGIDLLEEEFPDMSEVSTVRVMSTGLDDAKTAELVEKLKAIDYVDSVDYEKGSADYNVGENSLFVVNTDFEYESDEFASIMSTIQGDLSTEYNLIESSGETAQPEIPMSIIAAAVVIILIILLLMCSSWIEPFLFLAAIGIAVVVNMGTNAYFEWVSETTYSIVAILQLVLSMDYSIILSNRYRQELALGKEKTQAMKDGLAGAIAPIAGSALTTVVGLLILVFMSFKIGPDMGLVLGKGVAISLISILTILPTLILLCHNLIQKTQKKILNIPMGGISKFSFKNKKIVSILFVVFFVAMFLLKENMGISFLMFELDEIDEVFQPTNTVVVVYNNEDEATAAQIANNLESNENVKEVFAYGTTLGKPQNVEEMYDFILDQEVETDQTFDESMISLIYYDYFKAEEERTMTLSNFTEFVQRYTTEHPEYVNEEDVAQIEQFGFYTNKEELMAERSSTEISSIFGIDEMMVQQILMMSQKETISIVDFLTVVQSTPEVAQGMAQADPASVQQLQGLGQIIQSTLQDVEFTPVELEQMFVGMGQNGGFDEGSINLLFETYYSEFDCDASWELTIEQLFNHVTEMANDEYYASAFDEDIRADLTEFNEELQDGKNQLMGDNYAIMMLETRLPEESEETNELFAGLVEKFESDFSSDYYTIGNTPMQYELTLTFEDELMKITILTALAIFIVVLFTFRNIAVPIILVSLIQSAVYTTMFIYSVSGSSLNFLALLIVQSILMGATTDYAILFTNYYREKRRTSDVAEALTQAYEHSIHTIFTSGLILVLVPWIVSYAFSDPSIAQICRTISLGAGVAIILILFVLPSLIAGLDKITSGIKGSVKNPKVK